MKPEVMNMESSGLLQAISEIIDNKLELIKLSLSETMSLIQSRILYVDYLAV